MLEVDGTTVKFKDGVFANYEQGQVLHFFLRATDPDGLYVDQEFNLSVLNDISDDDYTPLAPTDILLDNLSIYENRMGENIANVTGIDPNGDKLTFVVFQSRDGVKLNSISALEDNKCKFISIWINTSNIRDIFSHSIFINTQII